jgi:hypothetical protein
MGTLASDCLSCHRAILLENVVELLKGTAESATCVAAIAEPINLGKRI